MTTPPTRTTDPGRALLPIARAGDEGAFAQLVEPRRRELHAHCYRMLGSVHDAEDALQETLLRAWRGLAAFEERSSLRSWFFRIATNVCLTMIERRPARVLPAEYGPPDDPRNLDPPFVEAPWLEPYPDAQLGLAEGFAAPAARYEQRESVELAFVAALQLLPARQRAALVMREVLGFSAREVADSLGTSVASVNSSLQRARKAIDDHLPEQSQQAAQRALGETRLRAIVDGYMDAMERADIPAVIAMLTEDATWSMPPIASWYRGLDDIAAFLRDGALVPSWRHAPTHANGQPAVGCYMWNPERGCYLPSVVDVLTLRGDRIASVTAFISAEIFPSFGLPAELPPR
jgi:RNA polymerase sigma-70 factor, ECF subfamily